MPVVTFEMWEGRTIEQKKQLAEGITSAFVKIGGISPPGFVLCKYYNIDCQLLT